MCRNVRAATTGRSNMWVQAAKRVYLYCLGGQSLGSMGYVAECLPSLKQSAMGFHAVARGTKSGIARSLQLTTSARTSAVLSTSVAQRSHFPIFPGLPRSHDGSDLIQSPAYVQA